MPWWIRPDIYKQYLETNDLKQLIAWQARKGLEEDLSL